MEPREPGDHVHGDRHHQEGEGHAARPDHGAECRRGERLQLGVVTQRDDGSDTAAGPAGRGGADEQDAVAAGEALMLAKRGGLDLARVDLTVPDREPVQFPAFAPRDH